MGGNAGMGSLFGQNLINMGVRFGGQLPASTTAPGPAPGAAYKAPAAVPYMPQMPLQGLPPSPLLQQIMAQNMQPMRGLGDLSAFNFGYVPRTMQSLPPLPAYITPASTYRPNMAPAQESLGRVAVSVAEQQRRAAQAELDRLKAEQEMQQSNLYAGMQSG